MLPNKILKSNKFKYLVMPVRTGDTEGNSEELQEVGLKYVWNSCDVKDYRKQYTVGLIYR